MKLTVQKPDSVGVFASSLCMIHCFATPFIFIAQAGSKACCETTPIWWQWIDFFFLVVAFIAVYHSTKISTNNYVKYGLWVSWVVLFVVIINEKMELYHLSEIFTYIAAISLVVLHLYNQKYCQCKNDKCCTHHK